MIHTSKWTCDRDGNWSLVPVILGRSGSGYVETRPAAPQPTDPSFKPISVDRLIQSNQAKSLLNPAIEADNRKESA